MLLGIASFAELPISTAGPDNSVTITAVKNQLTLSIGNPGITADSIVEIPTGSQVVLGLGTLTISGDANLSPTGSQVTLGVGTVTVTAGATIAASGNGLVISSGTVTITGSAVVNPTKASLILASGTVSAITWSEIIPGATMTWTPITSC
jgi:hypothetical protein|tara:strand:- start:68 stop:517 length:450 start_codon:yes stop_codon:yes gene_type:complete